MKLALLKFLRFCHLIGRKNYEKLKDYLTVESSPLFDADWYLSHNPDVKAKGKDPIWHYCNFGWKEGRLPGPLFSDVKTTEKRNLVLDKISLSKGPKISIVVASYNYACFIRETLDSILSQTYSNFEIIVVDDGSEDKSRDVIAEYVQRDVRVKLFTHQGSANRGLPETVKLGVSKARGEYVAFCESDDIWEPTHLEEKVRLIERSEGKADIIINDVRPFGDEGRVRAAEAVAEDRMRLLPKERNVITPLQFREKNWICTFSCCMVRRRILAQCNFTDVPRPANLDWWLWRQICIIAPVYVVRKKLTRWRMHKSFMAQQTADSIVRQRAFLEKMDALLVKRHPRLARDILPFVEELEKYILRDGKFFKYGKPVKDQPFFSIVMPTYNRKFCIAKAIDSALCQSYYNFELLIIDDGSTDGTDRFIQEKYSQELACGKIRYILKKNSGVCKTRNWGLSRVKGDWIAYLDSDNEMCPFFLEVFARAILSDPLCKNIYAKQVYQNSCKVVGRPFDLSSLMKANFIDLGVYVHRKDLIGELGGFDENMTRLVDWELIVRQTKQHTPKFLNVVVMIYNDSDGFTRVTNSAKLKTNLDYFKLKHCNYPIVTTMITAYNHRPYLKRAIESALMQQGEFVHEILIADDCSTDGTHEVLAALENEYPAHFKVLPTPQNLGIAANMRRCFAAARGKYIAVLEGDDYWCTPWKLNRQVRFLENNPDCSMVFSRIKILDEDSGKFSLLPRQSGLKSKLTGEDFIKDPNQNLIANFSCCMFVASLMKNLPEQIYAERVNEISVSFCLERKGPIGFLPDIMSVYRLHAGSTWSTADEIRKIQSAIRCREVALELCAPKYKERMKAIIGRLRESLKAAQLKLQEKGAR